MEKAIMSMMMVLMMMVVLSQVVLGMTPQKDYCCPIPGCGECFYTYEELYNHFTTAHPSEPIDIIWD